MWRAPSFIKQCRVTRANINCVNQLQTFQQTSLIRELMTPCLYGLIQVCAPTIGSIHRESLLHKASMEKMIIQWDGYKNSTGMIRLTLTGREAHGIGISDSIMV